MQFVAAIVRCCFRRCYRRILLVLRSSKSFPRDVRLVELHADRLRRRSGGGAGESFSRARIPFNSMGFPPVAITG